MKQEPMVDFKIEFRRTDTWELYGYFMSRRPRALAYITKDVVPGVAGEMGVSTDDVRWCQESPPPGFYDGLSEFIRATGGRHPIGTEHQKYARPKPK